MKIVRSIIAAPIGIIVLFVLTFPVIDKLGLRLFPLPEHMEIGKTSVSEAIAYRPFAAVLFNFVLRLPAVFVSAGLAARIAPRYGIWHGMAVSLLFVAMIVISALFAPFPLWVTLLGLVCFPIAGYLGALKGARPGN